VADDVGGGPGSAWGIIVTVPRCLLGKLVRHAVFGIATNGKGLPKLGGRIDVTQNSGLDSQASNNVVH